jgi:hypothetical protein
MSQMVHEKLEGALPRLFDRDKQSADVIREGVRRIARLGLTAEQVAAIVTDFRLTKKSFYDWPHVIEFFRSKATERRAKASGVSDADRLRAGKAADGPTFQDQYGCESPYAYAAIHGVEAFVATFPEWRAWPQSRYFRERVAEARRRKGLPKPPADQWGTV